MLMGQKGSLRTFSFTEWLRIKLGSQNYDYLTLSVNEDLYFVLKNESESKLIKVSKTQDGSEDIAVLIRSGEELKQPHTIDLGLNHKIVFEKGKMTVV